MTLAEWNAQSDKFPIFSVRVIPLKNNESGAYKKGKTFDTLEEAKAYARWLSARTWTQPGWQIVVVELTHNPTVFAILDGVEEEP